MVDELNQSSLWEGGSFREPEGLRSRVRWPLPDRLTNSLAQPSPLVALAILPERERVDVFLCSIAGLRQFNL